MNSWDFLLVRSGRDGLSPTCSKRNTLFRIKARREEDPSSLCGPDLYEKRFPGADLVVGKIFLPFTSNGCDLASASTGDER